MGFQASTTITTDSGFGMTSDEAAAAILAALGGDPSKDHALVTVQVPTVSGSAGTLPPPPEPDPPLPTQSP